LGFVYVAEQPLQLSCGHCVCSKCNYSNTSSICKAHNNAKVVAECPIVVTNKLPILCTALMAQFDSTLSLMKDTRTQFVYDVKDKTQKIKSQIDDKVNRLKNELDNIRDALYKQVDNYAEHNYRSNSKIDQTLEKAKEKRNLLNDSIRNY